MTRCEYVPKCFKLNYIVPIAKVKDCRTKSMTCNDFRGIAISPILSKVFEYCFLERFEHYLKSVDNQYYLKRRLAVVMLFIRYVRQSTHLPKVAVLSTDVR